MTLANMREHGVRSVLAVTEAEGIFALPDSLPAEIRWYPGPARQGGFIEYSYAVERRYEPAVWKEWSTNERRSADKGGTPNKPAMDAAETANMRHGKTTRAATTTNPSLCRSRHQQGASHGSDGERG
jgi:hypothetical protein